MSITLIQEIKPATELAQALTDLDMARILCHIDSRMKTQDAEAFAMQYYTSSSEEIAERLSALTDLKSITDPETLQQAIDTITAVHREEEKLRLSAGKLMDVLYRWRLIEAYTHCISCWNDLLGGKTFTSSRIQALQQFMKELQTEPLFEKCQQILSQMNELLPLPQYVYIGVNVREDGHPTEMSVLDTAVDAPALNSLLSHDIPEEPSRSLGPEFLYSRALFGSHFDEYLVRNFEHEWKTPLSKASKILEPIRLPKSPELLALARPLQFYQIGLLCAQAFESRGYGLCCPQTAADSSLLMKQVCYPELILHNDHIQGNDLSLQKGHAVIITGANHSGKTSYLKTIGQSYLLAQLGFMVPAEAMTFTPVEGIYTLFSAGEDSSMTASRMGVEIKKLSGILKQAKDSELVLLNEPMTSTNPVEAVSICADLSRHFLNRGITHLLVTHLYDIYFLLKAQLSEEQRPLLESLITCSEYDKDSGAMRHSYRLISAEPLGNSYARETATAYGITLSDMLPAGELLAQADLYCQTHNINSIYEGEDTHGLSDNH